MSGLLSSNTTTYANAFSYAPHGGILSMTLGNNIAQTESFNSLLQPTQIQAGSLLTLGYTYQAGSNNGNPQTQTITRPGVSARQKGLDFSRRGRRGKKTGMIECMATVHMTAAEVAKDIAAVLAKVRQGDEIVVEQDSHPVAVIKPPAQGPGRSIDECIALAEQREKERGYRVTLDPDFAADVEEIIAQRKPLDTSAWD